MKRLFYLLLSFIVVCFSYCTTERLKKTDYEWIPYKGWEVLVFQSNKGEIDTVFLTQRDTSTSSRGQYGMDKNYEYVDVDYRHRRSWDTEDTAGYAYGTIVTISPGSGNSRLSIYFETKNANYHDMIWEPIDSLNKVRPISLKTVFGTFNDIYVFEPSEEVEKSREFSEFITKLYWSKSEGVVRYEKKDEYWELLKKYRKIDRRFFDPYFDTWIDF